MQVLEARLKYYSSLRLPKAEPWFCVAYQIKLPEARETKHRNELIQTIINNNDLLFDIYYLSLIHISEPTRPY